MLSDSHCSTEGPGWSDIFPVEECIDVIEQLSCKFDFFNPDFSFLSWSFHALPCYQIRRLIFYYCFHFSTIIYLIDPEHEGTDFFQTSLNILQ